MKIFCLKSCYLRLKRCCENCYAISGLKDVLKVAISGLKDVLKVAISGLKDAAKISKVPGAQRDVNLARQ